MGRCDVLCVLVRCFVVVNLSVFTGFANGLRIPECIGGNIDIREDNNPENSITCEGFTATQGIRWTLYSDGAEQASITCGTTNQTCSHPYPGITVTRPNSTYSVLVLETLHRARLGNGYINCGVDGQGLGTSCNTRVIGSASAVTSTQPSSPGQASSVGTTTPQPTSTSTPSTTSSQVPNPSPTTTSPPGPSVTQPPSSPPHQGSSDQTSSPPHPGSSDRPSTSRSPLPPSSSPESGTAGGSSDGEKDVPLGAIVGGVIVAVVVIILIVIIVVVVRKRRQRSGHMMSGHAKYDTVNDEVEEHINPMYGTGPDDAEDGSPEKMHKPAAVAFRIPSSSASNNTTITTPTTTNAATALTTNANTRYEDPSGNNDDEDEAVGTGYSSVSFRRSQTSPVASNPPASISDPVLSTSATPSQPESAYAGLYAAADEDDFASPQVVHEDADSYAMLSDPTNQVPSPTVQPFSAEGGVGESDYDVGDVDPDTADTLTPGDVYAVVDKSGLRPASDINTTSSDTGEGESNDVYAVVDKPSVKKSAPADVTLGDDVTETSAEPTGDVYAQVVKSAYRDSASAPTGSMLAEAEDALYAQVQKGKAGFDADV